MSSRRMNPEFRTPGYQTRISIRASPPKEPRDECVGIPKPIFNRGPTPLDIELAQTKAPSRPPPPTPPILLSEAGTVGDPEIVDVAASKTWPRPADSPSLAPLRSSMSGNRTCPSRASRQSEMSFGILDYYIGDASPIQSPDLPIVSTPVLDPATDRFDFGLAKDIKHENVWGPDAKAGAAETEVELIHLSPPPALTSNPRPLRTKTYSLFPAVKEAASAPASHRRAQVINDSPTNSSDLADTTNFLPDSPTTSITQRHPTQVIARLESTPARRRAQTINTPSPTDSVHLNRLTSLPSHQQPHASYRPRKESLSSSISSRSRKDSCTSHVQSRLIPLRILSSSSTNNTAASRSSASTSTATSSPQTQSRWSDDTITSPTAATTPGPRTSFGSLPGVGRDSGQYPACFFEDDDEAAPLRRKYRWQNSWQRPISLTTLREGKTRSGRGRFDERRGIWRRVAGWMLCGGCRGRD